MSGLGFLHIPYVHLCVGGASAVHELDVLVGKLIFDVCAKVYIGNEKNVLFGHGRNNLDGRGRGHTDIANGFKLGGGVDVGNYRIAGIHFFKLFNNFSVHLLGHRASCVLVGEVNGLFGGENLDRFGHKRTPHIITVLFLTVAAFFARA